MTIEEKAIEYSKDAGLYEVIAAKKKDYTAGYNQAIQDNEEDAVKFGEYLHKHCQKMGEKWGTLYAGDGGKLYTHAEIYKEYKLKSQ